MGRLKKRSAPEQPRRFPAAYRVKACPLTVRIQRLSQFSGIRGRWFISSAGTAVIVLLLVAAGFSLAILTGLRTLVGSPIFIRVLIWIFWTAVTAGAVIAVINISGSRFLRTITEPIHDITALAQRISEGSYGIQVKKRYADEIGVLTDTINEMSEKIGRTECAQTEFISSVSHELRTPLTAITGWSETLLYADDIRGDSRLGLEIISGEAARLTSMVEELLEFTLIQEGRFSINVTSMNLGAELEKIILSYGQLLKKENLTLQYIPAAADLPNIIADPVRLRQVFLNILDNAAKYGGDGGSVVVTLVREGEYLAVRTRDFGPGIPEDELPFVKLKFYKGSSKARGSGIGLAVCDEIITRHEGELIVENAPGGGVLVTVTLPIDQTETAV